MTRPARAAFAAVLIAASLIVVGLIGCGQKPQPLPVQAIPWGDRETATYIWVQGGNQVGTGSFSQRLAEQGWVFHNTAVIGEYRHTGDVLAHPQTLIPLTSTVTNQGTPTGYAIDATYDGVASIVQLVAHTPQGDRELTVRLPQGHYIDNEQLLTTVRALPLSEGFKFTVNLINTAGGQKVPILVEVKGVETLAMTVDGLPGEEHPAYRVSLLGGAQTAWYTVDAAHILLKYDNGQMQTVLTGYVAGER